MKEIWRGITYQGENYSEFYEISNTGKIRNSKTKRETKTYLNSSTGYFAYCGSLGERGKRKLFKIHRCVAEAFIPYVEGKEYINHKDGNKQNNQIENLEWCTPKENSQHSWGIGTSEAIKGTKNVASKLSKEDVLFIRKNYIPRDKDFGTRGLGRKFNIDHMKIRRVINHVSYIED